MIPGRVQGATRILGAPAGWEEARDGPCGGLPIADIPASEAGGVPQMVSAWLPTLEEIAAIVAGAPVLLWVCGPGHPPVNLGVGEPPGEVAT